MSKFLNEQLSLFVILLIYLNFASNLIESVLDLCHFLVDFNSLNNVPSGILLDYHKFVNVILFIEHETVLKLLKDFIEVTGFLQHLEIVEEFLTSLDNIIRENIFLTIDPQMREAFHGRIENLN